MNNICKSLKLKDQLSFPLYACAKEIVRQHRKYLEPLGLTYTQYLVLLVLWEEKKISAKDLGDKIFLDSGTLTPVLKSLEKKGVLTRTRSTADERVLLVEITNEGVALRDSVLDFPREQAKNARLTEEEANELYRILYKLLQKS